MKLAEAMPEVAEINQQIDANTIAYYPTIAKAFNNDPSTAIIICQFMYWNKLQKDPDGWIYKTHEEIFEETAVTKKVQMRIFKKLEEMGFVKIKKKMVYGKAINHYLFDFEKIQNFIKNKFNSGKPKRKEKKMKANLYYIPAPQSSMNNPPENQTTTNNNSTNEEPKDTSSNNQKVTSASDQRELPYNNTLKSIIIQKTTNRDYRKKKKNQKNETQANKNDFDNLQEIKDDKEWLMDRFRFIFGRDTLTMLEFKLFTELIAKFGREKVEYSMIEAKKHNKCSYAYIEAIAEGRGKKKSKYWG